MINVYLMWSGFPCPCKLGFKCYLLISLRLNRLTISELLNGCHVIVTQIETRSYSEDVLSQRKGSKGSFAYRAGILTLSYRGEYPVSHDPLFQWHDIWLLVGSQDN